MYVHLSSVNTCVFNKHTDMMSQQTTPSIFITSVKLSEILPFSCALRTNWNTDALIASLIETLSAFVFLAEQAIRFVASRAFRSRWSRWPRTSSLCSFLSLFFFFFLVSSNVGVSIRSPWDLGIGDVVARSLLGRLRETRPKLCKYDANPGSGVTLIRVTILKVIGRPTEVGPPFLRSPFFSLSLSLFLFLFLPCAVKYTSEIGSSAEVLLVDE